MSICLERKRSSKFSVAVCAHSLHMISYLQLDTKNQCRFRFVRQIRYNKCCYNASAVETPLSLKRVLDTVGSGRVPDHHLSRLCVLLHQRAELSVVNHPVFVLVRAVNDLANFPIAHALVAEYVEHMLELATGDQSVVIRIKRLYIENVAVYHKMIGRKN